MAKIGQNLELPLVQVYGVTYPSLREFRGFDKGRYNSILSTPKDVVAVSKVDARTHSKDPELIMRMNALLGTEATGSGNSRTLWFLFDNLSDGDSKATSPLAIGIISKIGQNVSPYFHSFTVSGSGTLLDVTGLNTPQKLKEIEKTIPDVPYTPSLSASAVLQFSGYNEKIDAMDRNFGTLELGLML